MEEIAKSLDLKHKFIVKGDEYLCSRFAVTELATCSFGAVGSAIASLVECLGLNGHDSHVEVNRRLASLWFGYSMQPTNWELPPVWDAIAGDYQTKDGWIKLHTNFLHHRKAALAVLNVNADRRAVAKAVLLWGKDQLEQSIVEAGGVAAAMRTRQEWCIHPQGKAIASEPLIQWGKSKQLSIRDWQATQKRPLAGLRVLDLTRVLAGPVATRTLAGFGASVLRIDPPNWEEPNIIPDVTLGKRCARLDLNREDDRNVFEHLLMEADILIHGYRPGALEQLGYSKSNRQKISPALIEVSLNAYGWAGPWCQRRGFDSLVQMSCGIADAGMHWTKQNRPIPLPVQALDHATGYLMAAAAIRAITKATSGNGGANARLSLARTAELLLSHPQEKNLLTGIEMKPSDFSHNIEQTPWGMANRLIPAVKIANTPMEWNSASCELGSAEPVWV